MLGTITRPNFEIGRHADVVRLGQYQYTFKAKAPAGFDPTVTTTVAVDGNRDLTAFNLGTSYAGTTFNFVPNGSAVTVTRDVIRTAELQHLPRPIGVPRRLCPRHGDVRPLPPAAKRRSDHRQLAGCSKCCLTRSTWGRQLPSVVGTATTPGVPYQIVGFMNSVNDFSTVVDPADPQRCEVCHSQTTGAAQATAF